MRKNNNDSDGREPYEKIGEFVSIYKRGKTWWVNYQDTNSRQIRKSLSTRSKKEARLRGLKIENKLQNNQHDDEVQLATISEAIVAYATYLRAEDRAPKTLSKYRRIFRRIETLADERGVKDMRGVTMGFVDAYRKMRKDVGRAAKTIHNETTVLRQLVNFCLRRDMLDKDRLKALKLQRPPTSPQPCWTNSQVDQILEAAKSTKYHALYCVLSTTGMRIAEAKYLTWDDIDFVNSVLHVREKVIDIKTGKRWKPKNGNQRVIPLAKPTITLLQALKRRCRWVFTAPPTARFPRGDRPINERQALSKLKEVLKSLDLPGHLHTFRHSLISHALVSGTPEAVVREWAGQVDPQIIRLYTHIADADSKAYMGRLFPSDANGQAEGAGGGEVPTTDQSDREETGDE